jgi:hypothetical protein
LQDMYDQYTAEGHDDTLKPGTIPTDAAIAILDECIRQADIDKVCPKARCGQPIMVRKDGWCVCGDGHKTRSDFVNLPMSQIAELRWVVVKWANDNQFDIGNLVDVEQRLLATLEYADPNGEMVQRTLTGQLDAVFVQGEQDEEFIVIDWKDSWGLPGPSSVGFDGYFQQRFYAWLIFKNYPSASRVTLREFYVRFSATREATVYRSDIEDVEAEMAALAERFDRAHAESNFPPTPGQHCQFCPRPAACPIFPGVRAEGQITDRAQAARISKELTVAKAAVKARTAALSAWTSVHGPEEVSSHKGKRVWGHRPTTRTARPSKEDMEKALAARSAGVPINLDELYREAKTTRFELHAPVEGETVDPAAEDAALMSALEASVAASTVPRTTEET